MNLTMESAELVEVLLYVHKNRRLIRGGEPRTSRGAGIAQWLEHRTRD